MSSNVQTQINDLNAAVQALDSSLTQITGNTMSNYNQLSRIVAQQANIYNTVYYGTGNMSTGFLSVSANCNISGNLVLNNGNLNITRGNVILSNGNLGIGTTNPLATLDISGNARINGNVNIDNGLLWTDTVNNRIGVLNTNPQYALDVKGLANVSSNIFCAGISTHSTQSPLKILSGNITTNASGYYNFSWTQFTNTPYLVLTAIDDQVNMRVAFIRTISNTSANIRVVATDNSGQSVIVNYIVMGY